jgi:hypothetical protein
MTDLTYDPDHVARGVARLIDRYRKPRTSALLASWLDEVQQAEDALWQLLVERWLSSAVGDQLDVLGRIVGEPRRGRDDDTYRLWISARNLVSRSSGKTTELLAIVRTLVAPEVVIELEEYYPAAFVMRLHGTFTLDDGYQIAFMLRQAKAAGVLFQMTWPVDVETFRFAPADSPVLSSPFGFDAGAFAAVADGSFIPEPEVEPEFPPGTLVIDGVPLVIDGVPLVITPPGFALAAPAPAPLARLRPLVATPARIVPRVAPLALPTPLVGDFIELEDAFSDTSLEMDETGQLFRVAMALQGIIEDLQASDIDQAADITALQGSDIDQAADITTLQSSVAGQAGDITTLQSNVATLASAIADQGADLTDVEAQLETMRFAFSLRTTSVAGTDYEEIGVLRFDATLYGGALEFIAELEVAASGQTAELQLYNLTAASAVATLSTSALTTTKRSSTVTLPLSEALYSLRLRRVGGDSTQRVSCKSAILEVI